MKLLVKTSLYYLFFSIPILLISGFVCYFVITKEVKDSNNELLSNRKIVVEKYLKSNETIALNLITKSGEAEITKTTKLKYSNDEQIIFSDTLIYDKKENELANNRMISAIVTVKNTNYQIKIWRSTLEFDELFDGIFYLLLLILFFLFLATMLINVFISKTLWKTFNNTLNTLKSFSVSENKVPLLEKTTIKEFKALNSSLDSMMNKMISDFNSQKKFAENASHEIQTPLAVIKSKIDLLIQSQKLDDNDVNLIMAIDDACSKLIRLNKSLLLLTKIENRQFNDIKFVSFKETINNSLVLFQEHIEASNIEIIENAEDDFCVQMNPDLCLVLINNLLQNAIRYNIKKGIIEIFIDKNKIIISNTGQIIPIDSKLFERFHKNSNSRQSIGLGLSIIKEILEVSGLSLDYKYATNKHNFEISLKK